LTDLRSSIEIFLVEIVKKIGEKPAPQDKVDTNLNILRTNGYIDDRFFNLLHDVLYKWLWSYLCSNKGVHKREKVNIYEAEFVIHIFEEFMDFLIKKVVYRI